MLKSSKTEALEREKPHCGTKSSEYRAETRDNHVLLICSAMLGMAGSSSSLLFLSNVNSQASISNSSHDGWSITTWSCHWNSSSFLSALPLSAQQSQMPFSLLIFWNNRLPQTSAPAACPRNRPPVEKLFAKPPSSAKLQSPVVHSVVGHPMGWEGWAGVPQWGRHGLCTSATPIRDAWKTWSCQL